MADLEDLTPAEPPRPGLREREEPTGRDELTEAELLRRAKELLYSKGWKPGDKFSAHSTSQLMLAFGLEILKQPPADLCGYPDCGCEFDAICDVAIPKAALTDAQARATADAERLERAIEHIRGLTEWPADKAYQEDYSRTDWQQGYDCATNDAAKEAAAFLLTLTQDAK